ncbi:MAG: hypothetical protein RLZZ373_2631 [Pseudomonadota bacterium]|jgi:hypothetical protein
MMNNKPHLRQGKRLCLSGYVDMLNAVRMRQQTAQSVAANVGVIDATAASIMWRMADLGLVHEIRWTDNRRGWGDLVPIYAFGPGPRVPNPNKVDRHRVSRHTLRTELVALSHLMRALIEGPHSISELVDICGITRTSVAKLVKHCRAIKMVRIADWETPASCQRIAMYAIGSAKDEPKPQRQTNAERNASYRNRRVTGAAKQLAQVFQFRLAEAA